MNIGSFVDREFDPYCFGYSNDVLVYTLLERNYRTKEYGVFEIWVPQKTRKFVGCEMRFFSRATNQTQILPSPKGEKILKLEINHKKLSFEYVFFDNL